VEHRVLSGLKDRLLAPELVAEFVRAFAKEMAEADRHAAGMRSQLEAQLADVDRRLQGVLRAIENGAWSDALRERLAELETRRTALRHQLETANEPAPIIRLHPNAAEIYRAKVANLEASLNTPEIKAEASDGHCHVNFCRTA
jgi:site-specific DNA recombinase